MNVILLVSELALSNFISKLSFNIKCVLDKLDIKSDEDKLDENIGCS